MTASDLQPSPASASSAVWRALLVAISILLVGCAGGGTPEHDGPYVPQTAGQRDPEKARALTQEGISHVEHDPDRAEALFLKALSADLYHGPAHNNLGVLYLKRTPPMLYEAASEFEWARKLIPGHPDPRVNLALTLERAGRSDDAMNAYETALEVYPNYLPAVQGLVRLQLRTGKRDQRTADFLEEVMMRGESAEWRAWAQREHIAQQSREMTGTR